MQTKSVVAAIGLLLSCGALAWSALQPPRAMAIDEKALRGYEGVYRWDPNAFVYLQLWNEFGGTNQLVAFDESGEIRTLYPTERDQFFSGPAAAVQTSVQSRIEFRRNAAGRIESLTWQREGGPARVAQRVDIEKHDEVRFASGAIQLAGTLITPATGATHPAMILVHGSGAESRDYMLPFAHFLVRRGMALLTYDKRGVGGSTGDWKTASFDDLSQDVSAAFEYLKTRPDIDSTSIGVLGVSQAGWIMPLAAVRSKEMAFLISVSGAGVPATETTIDHAQREMAASGMAKPVIEQIVDLMKLEYEFARTGQGWEDYTSARAKLAARMGQPPDTFPGTQDAPYWQMIRRSYLYDPAPTLRQLQIPTLALFGALDDNILAEKNRAAWDAAMRAGGNRDFTLRVLPKANHLQLEATTGTNGEMPSLQRFVPEYSATIVQWLAARIRGFDAIKQ